MPANTKRGRAEKAEPESARRTLRRVRSGVVRAPARPDDCFQHDAQLLAVERFLQQRNARVPFLHRVAVSGHECKGDILCEQDVCNLVAVLLFVDADVHERAVEVLFGS